MDKPHDSNTCVGCSLNRLVIARYGSEGQATIEQLAEFLEDLALATAQIVNAAPSGPLIYSIMLEKYLREVPHRRQNAPVPSDDIHADMSVKH